ncbi:MarR family winged helix-turn-helix transcriptional regulator [Nocardioides mangrovi]|uniref:MarR family winged helix-turn-helix transcriptional regulator n=1 Tax=Nocardioides mangrovi TaxID=2874580 RepID=UPI0021E143E3|nr:MarR family transcriptional regulator [Nocardioides mangrovi]
METDDRTEPLDLGVLLAVAWATFFDRLHHHMADRGFANFTTRTGFLLRVLDSQALSLREVADRLEVSSPAALKVVVAMEEEGYVERVSTPGDRRVRAISPTLRGLAALAEARAFHREYERRMAARLGEDSVIALRRALEEIGADASEAIPGVLRQRAESARAAASTTSPPPDR